MPDKPLPLKPDNVDSPADDPKKALLVDLKGIIDRYNQLLAYLGSAAGKDAGTEAGDVPVYESGGNIAGLRMKANTARDGLVRLATLEQVRNSQSGDAVLTLSGLGAIRSTRVTKTFEYKPARPLPSPNKSREYLLFGSRYSYHSEPLITYASLRIWRSQDYLLASFPTQSQTYTWHAPSRAGVRAYPVQVTLRAAPSGKDAGTTSFGSSFSLLPGRGTMTKDVEVVGGQSYQITVGRSGLRKGLETNPRWFLYDNGQRAEHTSWGRLRAESYYMPYHGSVTIVFEE